MFGKTKTGMVLMFVLSASYVGASFHDIDDIGGEIDLFSVFDIDRDGRISMEEMTIAAFNMIQNDRDGDHYLTRDELQVTEDYNHFMASFDFNKDNKLTMEEIPAPIRHKLMGLDTNRDQVLSAEELQVTEDYDHFMAKFDLNQDGRLTESEIPESLMSDIMQMDTNHDHGVTMEELRAFQDVGEAAVADLQTTEDYDSFMVNFDFNKDGLLSPSEIPEVLRAKLMKMDKDGDSMLTPEELQITDDYNHFMAMFDLNRDSRLSPSEIPEDMINEVMDMDRDRDGHITIDELTGEQDSWN